MSRRPRIWDKAPARSPRGQGRKPEAPAGLHKDYFLSNPEQTTVAPKRGMAIVANDKIAEWLLPFLESWQRHDAHIPLYLIPYDDNLTVTRRAARAYGVTMVEEVDRRVDKLAADLYPLFPGYRRRLRKLQSLALPLDEVIYIDVDIVLFRDFSPMFGLLTIAWMMLSSSVFAAIAVNVAPDVARFLTTAKSTPWKPKK